LKILILHMRFHPDLTGTGPLVTDLATDLVRMGDEVSVVASMPHYGRSEVGAEYAGRLIHRSKFNGVNLFRTSVYVPPSPSGFYRSLNYLSYTFMSVAAGVMAGRPDVILCVNPPITVGFSGWVVSLARRAPMVFNVQDVWPDCLMIIGQLRNRVLIRTFKELEKFIYRVSSRVTVLSEGMKANLVGKRVLEEKITVIPNWANVDKIVPTGRENGFRHAHGLDGRFVAMFAGNLGYISMLDNVLEAAGRLQSEEKILFLIVGEGNAKAGLVRKAEEMELTNVRFLPTQPKAMLPDMLGAADISLVTLNRELGRLNVPSKTYSIMASARPVLAAVPQDSEIAGLVGKAQCGVWVLPEDPRALADKIRTLSRQPEYLDRLGSNGRDYVCKHYSRQKLTQRYHDLLCEVFEETRKPRK
jgi:colanic acid biosynthesis glycosyl transferase WcaI